MPAMQVALAVCGCFILTVCLSVATARRYAPVHKQVQTPLQQPLQQPL